jgi:hypothetical protein
MMLGGVLFFPLHASWVGMEADPFSFLQPVLDGG